MQAGGFNLRKWRTNSAVLQQRIKQAEQERGLNTVQELTQEGIKILGMSWDVRADEFYFDLKEVIALVEALPPTRQSVLKISAKLFDPLGILSPFVIGTKILFQTLCKDEADWDQELEGNLLKRWNQITKEIKALSNIKIPRCYYIANSNPVLQEVHGFCDASEKAYAAAIYLRSIYEDGNVSICLVSSKTRVAPLKRQTIPRLELLLGATILARLLHAVLTCLTINPDVYCWTDSFTVLCWIKNDKTW